MISWCLLCMGAKTGATERSHGCWVARASLLFFWKRKPFTVIILMIKKEMTNSFVFFSQDLLVRCFYTIVHHGRHQKNPRFLLWTYLLYQQHSKHGTPYSTTFIHGNLLLTPHSSIQYLSVFPSFHGKSHFFGCLSCCELWICGGNGRHLCSTGDDVGIGKTRLHTHQIFHNVSWSISFILE